MAVLNGGTIPDRGLYGVFLASEPGRSSRVGELDEEMVFETHPGDVFLLGASSWRVLEITHDRVLVAPAPGEPGKMPFWRGEGPGRPVELGRYCHVADSFHIYGSNLAEFEDDMPDVSLPGFFLPGWTPRRPLQGSGKIRAPGPGR